MYKHRVFNKGEYCYGLVSSANNQNVLIPCKLLIKDVSWDYSNPKYKVKIVKIYESIHFIKKFLYDKSFKKDFKGNPMPFYVTNKDISSVSDLENEFNGEEEEKYYIIIDSLMCVKHKTEMVDLFNKMQTYLIASVLSEFKHMTRRQLYKGPFKLDSQKEFFIRMKKSFEDTFEDSKIDFEEFFKTL
jgi:hypothetical protein